MLMLNQADNVDEMVHDDFNTSYKRITMTEIIMILVTIIFINTFRIGGCFPSDCQIKYAKQNKENDT